MDLCPALVSSFWSSDAKWDKEAVLCRAAGLPLSTQHEFPYLPDYFVTNLGSEWERWRERENEKQGEQEVAVLMVFWDCLRIIGLFCSYWCYWVRQSQSDKTVLGLGRRPRDWDWDGLAQAQAGRSASGHHIKTNGESFPEEAGGGLIPILW